ncbi:MAG: hypothetical protein LBJ40_16785 [Delftia acidovorans]|jgi:hypothetical protein|uniref:hypothetical protein n=1 Tax=Delftia acidovorans TaxID=80866 RepID=UPI00283089CF|nr:hypothetical protein [Delftia acidovorans]
MKKTIAAIFFMTQALAVTAGSSSGKVTTLIVNSENYLFFNAGAKTGSPACGNNQQWAINLSTPKGKSIYVMLLAAQMQDKTVTIYGNQTCNEWGDREDVYYGVMDQ